MNKNEQKSRVTILGDLYSRFRWGPWYRLRPIYSIPWCIHKAEHGRYPLFACPWSTRRKTRASAGALDVSRVVEPTSGISWF